MVVSNPREPVLWTPRTQEMMGGWNPREVLDHDINPNEDGDGLSHHGRETPEDARSRDQQDPKKRKEQAMRELAAPIPHVSIRPEKIDDTLGRSPQFEQEQRMLEAGVGMDLNRNGIGLSNGFNAGSVRTEGPNVKYGQSNSVVPAMLGKAADEKKCKNCGYKLEGLVENAKKNGLCSVCDPRPPSKSRPLRTIDMPSLQEAEDRARELLEMDDEIDPAFGDTRKIPYFRASEDIFEQSWDSISKGKRRYKGRHMYDDEESDEDERKSKKKRKRKKKRDGKRKKPARGGRQIKSITTRRKGNVETDVDRGSRRQAFHPNIHSEAIRGVGRSRTDRIPLRLRDPIAWERKKASERLRRQMGSLPRGLTHHADTRGIGTKRGAIQGGSIGTGTKMPTVARMGTSTKRFSRDAVGDPLSTHDPLFSKSDIVKAKPNISRSEIMAMKRKIEKLLQQLNKLTKATPELGNEGKVGAQANSDTASSPTGGTKLNEEEEPYRAFFDMALAQEMGLVGKK